MKLLNSKQIQVPNTVKGSSSNHGKYYRVRKKQHLSPNQILSDVCYGMLVWGLVMTILLKLFPDVDTRLSVLVLPVFAIPWFLRKNL